MRKGFKGTLLRGLLLAVVMILISLPLLEFDPSQSVMAQQQGQADGVKKIRGLFIIGRTGDSDNILDASINDIGFDPRRRAVLRDEGLFNYLNGRNNQNRHDNPQSAWHRDGLAGSGWVGGQVLHKPNINEIVQARDRLFDKLGRPDDDDIFLLVFAGHGRKSERDLASPIQDEEVGVCQPNQPASSFDCLSRQGLNEADPAKPGPTGCTNPPCDEVLVTGEHRREDISDDVLVDLIFGVKGTKVLIFGSCFSGGLADGRNDLIEMADNVIVLMACGTNEYAYGTTFSHAHRQQATWHSLFLGSLIAGLEERQPAVEGPRLPSGGFKCFTLIKADGDGNCELTVQEWFDFAQDLTIEKLQEVTINGTQNLRDTGGNIKIHKDAQQTPILRDKFEGLARSTVIFRYKHPLLEVHRTRDVQRDGIGFCDCSVAELAEICPIPHETPSNDLGAFDTNNNRMIDDPEFFEIVDAWIAEEIDDTTFFRAIDLWISEAPIAGLPPPQLPVSPCSINAELMALWRGNPISDMLPVTGETTLGIAFNQAVLLPQGTSLQLNVSSTNPALKLTQGQWRPPLQGQFSALSPTALLGLGSTLSAAEIPAQKELAQVTLQPAAEMAQPGAQLLINLTLSLPGCPSLQLQTTVSLHIQPTMPPPPGPPPPGPPPPPKGFVLNVSVVGEGGRVISSPPGIDCLGQGGGDCSESYPSATPVLLVAEPQDGWVLAGWQGCDSFFENECELIVNEIKSVTVTFALAAPIGEGLLLEQVVVKSAIRGITFSSRYSVPIQVEVYDLSGRSVFSSSFASTVRLDWAALGRPLANGVYLYVVRAQGADGEFITSRVKKLMIWR